MTKHLLILLVFIGFGITHSKAQTIKEFSDNPSFFLDELKEFMNDSKSKPAKNMYELFEATWTNMGFEAQDQLIVTFNTLLKAKYRPSPDFIYVLESCNSFVDNNIEESTYIEYLQVLSKVAESKLSKTKSKEFSEFITTYNKSRFLNNSSGKVWSLTPESTYRISFTNSPIIEVEGVDLMLKASYDSLEIIGTSGTYNILSNHWRGKNGEVTWERAGLSPSVVYAELKNYQLSIKHTSFEADSVTFYNSDVYSFPLEGRLENNLHQKGEDGPYPKFTSYKGRLQLDGLEDYMTYKGGFGMEGKKILGTGAKGVPASIVINRNGKKFIKLESFSFYIDPESVIARETGVTIYINNDSIIHPSLYLNINRKDRYINLSTTTDAISNSPFLDTYHYIDIYADNISHHLDSNFLEIKALRDPDGRATFESSDYFSSARFEKIRGGLDFNPLYKLNTLSNNYDGQTYFNEDQILAAFNANRIESLQPLLFILNKQGFITYSLNDKSIIIKDKLFNYVKAYLKKIDYDVIQLNSVIKSMANSRLNLENLDLEIRGIKMVKLSDSQNVEIYPYKQIVTLKENRNFNFSGYMRAGRFEYFGSGFEFNYDEFKIDMKQIDSMLFNFPDAKLKNQLRKVNTVVQDITGYVLIDKSNNKSGRFPAPEYPIFDCSKEAYVYYDYLSVYGGVYDRERFNFKLKPFVVDSLDNFSLNGINLLGTFNSGKILPTFDYELSLQNDFSLGFRTVTPDEGYPLYGGKGHCNMDIYLSNRGLEGNGVFTYNGAEIKSDKMLFFLDSMKATNTVFHLENQKNFPYVNSEKADLNWVPYNDTMKIATIDSNSFINMYESESYLKGHLIFTKKSMFGSGEFNYKHSIAKSDYFDFKKNNLAADSSYFTLYDDDKTREALISPSVLVEIDFNKQLLKGTALSDTAYTQLPLNQYSTNIPNFRWEYQQKKIYLEKGADNEDLDFFFVSTNPVYDSLSFTPQGAELNLENYNIEAFNIKYITVADSRIKPDSAITIGESGQIPALENAEITTSFENEFHFIKKASVNISSSKIFSAYGFYQYIDKDDQLQEIYMREIRSTDSGITIGVGEIPDTMLFYFGPNMLYTGDVNFRSDKKAIEFDGSITLTHPYKFELATEKLQYQGLAATDSLYLDVTEQKNVLGQDLYTGLFMNSKTNRLYPLFLGRKSGPEDYAIFEAEGLLSYNTDSNRFIISPFERIFENDLQGSVWQYDTATASINFDGPMSFGYDFQNFDLILSGLVDYNVVSEDYTMMVTGGINFPFDNNALKQMGDSLLSFAYFNENTSNLKEYIVSGAIRQFEKRKEAEKAVTTIYNTDILPTYKEYAPIFQISEMELKWDTTELSFISSSKINLANVDKTPINKEMNAQISFVKKPSLDSISVYVEANPGSWYFFTFAENVLYFNASDGEIVEKALGKLPKDIKGKFDMKEADILSVEKARSKIIR